MCYTQVAFVRDEPVKCFKDNQVWASKFGCCNCFSRNAQKQRIKIVHKKLVFNKYFAVLMSPTFCTMSCYKLENNITNYVTVTWKTILSQFYRKMAKFISLKVAPNFALFVVGLKFEPILKQFLWAFEWHGIWLFCIAIEERERKIKSAKSRKSRPKFQISKASFANSIFFLRLWKKHFGSEGRGKRKSRNLPKTCESLNCWEMFFSKCLQCCKWHLFNFHKFHLS